LYPFSPTPAPHFCNTFQRYALLLLLSCARAGEPPAVAKKVLLWSIEAAQKGKQASKQANSSTLSSCSFHLTICLLFISRNREGLADCGKKSAAHRVAPVRSDDAAAALAGAGVALEREAAGAGFALERGSRGGGSRGESRTKELQVGDMY